VFKEGNRECIDILIKPSKSVLDSGVAIRHEPYEKRLALWHEIKTNAGRYKNGECGTFLKDLHAVFLARFDASLLLLALAFQQNNESFEESAYFSTREIEAYEMIERYGYFRILTRGEIAKKIRNKDEKTLALLREYAGSAKKKMDNILGDPGIRDTIRSYLKKQWDENTKKVGEAIASAGVDLEWFSGMTPDPEEERQAPQTIIINAGNDAAINLGTGNIVKDAVVTGSTIESEGSGGTTVQDSVVTKSTLATKTETPAEGITIRDSVVTSSEIRNVGTQPAAPEPVILAESPSQSSQNMCLVCKTVSKPGTRFCTTCGAKISPVCASCQTPLSPTARFCPECGRKIA
jgi:hypothetical protein